MFEDIFPDAVKLGMISSAAQTEVIAERLAFYRPRHTVVDPVMVATSGARLMQEDAVAALQDALLPLASLITPNIPEAEILSGLCISEGRTWNARRGRSLTDTAAPFSSRADTGSKMRTISCVRIRGGSGSAGNASAIQYARDGLYAFRGDRL